MKRRSFLAMLGLAPVAAVGSIVPQAEAASAEGSVRFRAEARSGASGWAMSGMEVRSSGYRSAGLFIDAAHAPTRVVFEADQYVISDGPNGYRGLGPKA